MAREKPPSCSVVIPAFNRGRYLVNTLTTLAQQQHDPNDFEAVVVNDGSTDGTGAMVQRLELPFHVTYIEKPNRDCRAETRNVGVRAARGEIVIFLDAEMLCPPGFIGAHLGLHRRFAPCVVCGWDRRIELPVGGGLAPRWLERARQATGTPRWYPGKRGTCFLPFITSNCSCRRADVFEVGLFDEAIRGYGHEDIDIGMRLYLLGRRFVSDSSTVAYHQAHAISRQLGQEVARNRRYYRRKHLRRRHVVHFVDAVKCGGVERHLLALARHLHGRQHIFTIVTADGIHHFNEQFAELGVPVHRLGFSQLDRFLASRPVDLIHIHHAPTKWRRYLLRANAAAPMIATVHSKVRLAPHPRLRLILCVSDSVLRRQPGPPSHYRILRPGTDPEHFGPGGHKQEMRRELGIPQSAFVVGTAARLDVTKLSERMLPIYVELVRLRPDLHVVVYADGSDLERSRRHVQEQGLSDRIRFPGPVHDMSRHLEVFDACVHAVECEPFGLAILEAMAKGLPVVAPDIDGISETVEDGKCGFLCSNAREVIQRTLELADGVHDVAEMGRSGIKRARLFDERRTALRHKLTYDEVIDAAH
ncbi:MAG: glycosyltransferase, partial [Armatimonadota bacterium]